MILSVSRRTDIPAYYGPWFQERLRAGFCLVPNPFNPRQVSRVSLARKDVDAFVFWTRDSRPFTPVLDDLDRRGDPYLFLFTLTGYGPSLEPGAPEPREAVAAFRDLATRLGPDRVVWRFDPILFGPHLGPAETKARFAALASGLEGATGRVKVSFLDLYRKTRNRLHSVDPDYVTDPALHPEAGPLLEDLASEAARRHMVLTTCAETGAGASAWAGSCIDPAQLAGIMGSPVPDGRDRGQRTACRCAPSRDVGVPDTCLGGCVYCYATRSQALAQRNHRRHDPQGPSILPLTAPA